MPDYGERYEGNGEEELDNNYGNGASPQARGSSHGALDDYSDSKSQHGSRDSKSREREREKGRDKERDRDRDRDRDREAEAGGSSVPGQQGLGATAARGLLLPPAGRPAHQQLGKVPGPQEAAGGEGTRAGAEPGGTRALGRVDRLSAVWPGLLCPAA